jgi:hypothetical protein
MPRVFIALILVFWPVSSTLKVFSMLQCFKSSINKCSRIDTWQNLAPNASKTAVLAALLSLEYFASGI